MTFGREVSPAASNAHGELRYDWQKEEIDAIYHSPIMELLYHGVSFSIVFIHDEVEFWSTFGRVTSSGKPNRFFFCFGSHILSWTLASSTVATVACKKTNPCTTVVHCHLLFTLVSRITNRREKGSPDHIQKKKIAFCVICPIYLLWYLIGWWYRQFEYTTHQNITLATIMLILITYEPMSSIVTPSPNRP